MTQPQRGSARTGVNDLRNIVERLDLLMGSTAGGTADAQDADVPARLEAVLEALGDRITALEGGLEELRTLVNHLMTIATWQAKVTATLVEEEVEEIVLDDADDGGVYERADGAQQPNAQPEPVTVPEQQYVERDEAEAEAEPLSGYQRQGGAPLPQSRPLDDDIDDILGTNRDATEGHAPPPDFGI